MAHAVHSQGDVVVDAAVERLFHAVEIRILLVYLLGDLAGARDIPAVALPGREHDVVMHLVERLRGVEESLSAYAQSQNNAYGHAAYLLSVDPGENEHHCKADERDTHRQHLLVMLAVVRKVGVEQHSERDKERSSESPALDLLDFIESLRAENYQQKADHERVAVGQPVRHLSAVPHHVHRADIHAQDHHADEHRRSDTLPRSEAAAGEIQYRADQGERTRV